MNCSLLRFSAALMPLLCIAHVQGADRSPPVERMPIVGAVWITPGSAGGKEVVIRPDGDKLAAHGLTFEQLSKAVDDTRFVEGKWTVEIGGKSIKLQDVAQLVVRKVEARPFHVELKDGRTVSITPDPARVAHYVITGRDFEKMVRHALADFTGPDPAEWNVLSGIFIPGNVGPHLTERGTMRHIS